MNIKDILLRLRGKRPFRRLLVLVLFGLVAIPVLLWCCFILHQSAFERSFVQRMRSGKLEVERYGGAVAPILDKIVLEKNTPIYTGGDVERIFRR